MGSLTFSEMLTIAVVVLIVFGPKRLPELARRAGAMLARVRAATREIREELQTEYRDTLEPLADLRADLEEARRDLRMARDELAQAATDVTKDVEQAQRDISKAVRDSSKRREESAPTQGREDGDTDKPVSPGGPTDLRASGGSPGDAAKAGRDSGVSSRSMSGLAPLEAVREELKAAREALEAGGRGNGAGGSGTDGPEERTGSADAERVEEEPTGVAEMTDEVPGSADRPPEATL